MNPILMAAVDHIKKSPVAPTTSILGDAIKYTRAGKFDIVDLKQIKEMADQYISCYNTIETRLRAVPRDFVHIAHVDRLRGIGAEAMINLIDAGAVDPDSLLSDAGVALSTGVTSRDVLITTVDRHREQLREFMFNCVTAGFMIRGPDPLCQL